MAGGSASGITLQQENTNNALQGGLITHTATASALQTYTPAPANTFDTAIVTNFSNATWIRITLTAVGTTGTKVYLVAPTQSVTVGFEVANLITSISSVPVVMPAVQGAIEVGTLVANATPNELVYVSIVLVEK